MGEASRLAPVALVVEDNALVRETVAMLLEEDQMGVIQCSSAEEAQRVLERIGACVSMIFTDVNLSGFIDGVELAHFAHHRFPNIHVVVTSGLALPRSLPEGATFMPKPWVPRDVLREAERAKH